MTQCGYYKIKRKKKRRIILFVFLLLTFAVCAFMAVYVRPVIRTVSQETIKSMTVDIVNASVAEVMEENPAYVDLTEVIKDSAGDISVITTNAAAVNSLARNVTENAQNNLSEIGNRGVGIPIGSLSGISFLAGRGPNVKIKAVQVGNIDTAFSSEFISVGINQTLHKFFIDVSATVNIIIPGAENKITTVTQVLVSESIIIGKIPEVYLQTNQTSGKYNLVP